MAMVMARPSSESAPTKAAATRAQRSLAKYESPKIATAVTNAPIA